MAKKTSKAPAADGTKPLSKSEVMATLAEKTGLPKKDVATLFDELSDLISKQLGKRGPGLFTVPGLMKLRVIRKPATKARRGINPFTKEETIFKAKPAKNVVKISPLKSLKDMV
jgi:nucleoid DNA-binding protein